MDPATLFDAPTLKAEANPKARVCRHLQVRRAASWLVWAHCLRCNGQALVRRVLWLEARAALAKPEVLEAPREQRGLAGGWASRLRYC